MIDQPIPRNRSWLEREAKARPACKALTDAVEGTTTKRIGKGAWVFALLLLPATRLAAQEAGDVGDDEVKSRLASIQDSFDAGQNAADLWQYGWLSGYSAATVGQLAIFSNTNDENRRQDMLVGAVTTALGVGGQLIFPLQAGRFAVRLRGMPADTPEARRIKLAAAEGYFRKAAAQETFGRSWKTQSMALAVNLAAGLTIWLHYDRSARDGFVTFAVGQIVAETQIFSQPMRAVRDLREYEQRTGFGAPGMAATPRHNWYVRAAPGDFVVGYRF